ncbi:MAG TPA: SPOR domain-containing protein [Dyadobacter sp.]|jgi:cell division septation protein DedD|nr:SPOR domain-containing protein [Dyadobacter sp.]
MTAVETVIKKLVSDYEFVIIPGFGALLSRQIPAAYDRESGVFAPPVKKLAFNEFLKLDDGFLANYISRDENISHTEAIARIKEYTENLKSTLMTNGQTVIEDIGYFNKNVEGKLVFEPNISNCFKDEWYGFSKVSVNMIDRTEAVKVDTIQLTEEEHHVEVLELDSTKVRRVSWVRWASAAMLAGLMVYVSFFLVNANSGNNKSTLNPFDFSSEEYETVLVAPAPSESPSVEAAASEVKAEPNKTDSVDAEPKAIAVTPVVTTPSPAIDKKKFYLIAGAFNGMKRANIMREDLQEKGFKDAVVIPAGKHSKKITVAVQSFDVENEAYAASGKLKSVIGEPGWVLKMK